jgi:hypothetical protein
MIGERSPNMQTDIIACVKSSSEVLLDRRMLLAGNELKSHSGHVMVYLREATGAGGALATHAKTPASWPHRHARRLCHFRPATLW